MITIEKLTPHQCEMLNTIWAFETIDDFLVWQFSLNKQDWLLSKTLVQLINLALIDQELEKSGNTELASVLLQNISSRG